MTTMTTLADSLLEATANDTTRGAALARFNERGWPTRRDEAFRYLDLRPVADTPWQLTGADRVRTPMGLNLPGAPDGCILNGCTDPSAFNFEAAATHNDGSCLPKIWGCTDAAASNYEAFFNTDDGSCRLPGCLDDPSASNYDADAAFDDGSCSSRRAPRRL